MDDLRQMRLTPNSPTGRVETSVSEASARRALARGRVMMRPETTAQVASNTVNKGDVLAFARVAGIQAAKQAAALLPMSHLVAVGNVYVNFTLADTYVEVEASVDTFDRTGVEMEAMTAVTVACLTIYDMCKSLDDSMSIEQVALWEKAGGRKGTWRRDATPSEA